MIISHFDQDHVGGLITVLEELSVKNVIIGKQFENSENYKEFLNIENNLYFDVIWPTKEQAVSENSINNNALVCKLNYKDFSMLFTGDIEKQAEQVLVSKYGKSDILKSTILKVGHHGSKTSSTQEFLELVKAKVALIGVGENNNFGHPNSEVLQRIENLKCEIYRTDKMGEISVMVNMKGNIKVKKFIE